MRKNQYVRVLNFVASVKHNDNARYEETEYVGITYNDAHLYTCEMIMRIGDIGIVIISPKDSFNPLGNEVVQVSFPHTSDAQWWFYEYDLETVTKREYERHLLRRIERGLRR